MKFISLVLFFKLISAKISIDIQTGANASDLIVHYSGSESKIVTKHDIEIFDITTEKLKAAAKKHFGRKPSNVYLKKPTPWGLYDKYNWEQVKRVLKIKSARVKNISKKPVLVLAQDFENSFNSTIKVNCGISQTVENTITTSWTKNKEITLSQEVEYNVNVLFSKMTGTTGFSFSTSWGESEERSETVSIGSTSGAEIELKPGQQATASLMAHRGSMEVEITYVASLRGNLAVNFKRSHNGHHFWGPTIENVMKSGDMSNEVIAIELIKVAFYADATLKVYDKVTGTPL